MPQDLDGLGIIRRIPEIFMEIIRLQIWIGVELEVGQPLKSILWQPLNGGDTGSTRRW
jgi:hypothetical protein